MATKIFVNLPVKKLDKSKSFFEQLGYGFDKQFTDENAACLIISNEIYAMLLTKKFFKRFTKKTIVNATKSTEVIIALSADSREKVDEIADKALAAGGKSHRESEEQGWMYSRSFEDLDGHIWEILYMDPSKIDKSN